jgi:hypothetical protein
VKALLLAALLTQAPDAPLLDEPGRVMELEAGNVVPFDATCLDKHQALRTAKRVAAAEAERDALKESHIGWPIVVGAILGAVALGVGAGYAAGKLVK